ncbi:hypothetical protein KCU75_g19, partial [Aureobasidium melanogenum]
MSSQCTRSLASLLSMLKKRPSGLLASIIILYTLINPFIEARWPSGLRRQLKVNSDTLVRKGCVKGWEKGRGMVINKIFCVGFGGPCFGRAKPRLHKKAWQSYHGTLDWEPTVDAACQGTATATSGLRYVVQDLTPQHPERSPRALDDASRRITSGMTSRENHRQPVQPETRVIWANKRVWSLDVQDRLEEPRTVGEKNTVKKDYGGSLHVLDDRLTDVGLVDQQEMYEARQGGHETSVKSPKHHIRIQQNKKHHGPSGQLLEVVGKEVDDRIR